MNYSNTPNNDSLSIDLLLKGFNFTAGLLALSALRAKLKVTLQLSEELNTSFQPELSCYYPQKISETINAVKNIRFLLKCSKLAPSLFLPQRVLTFSTLTNRKTYLNNTVDSLLRRDRESASFPINTSKYPEYINLSKYYSQASLVYEVRFDRNRAIVELLKQCLENGLKIIPNIQTPLSKIILQCTPYQPLHHTIEIKDFKWPLKNNLWIEYHNFKMTVQRVMNGTLVEFFFNNTINLANFQNTVHEEFEKLNIPISEILDHQLQEIIKKNHQKYTISNSHIEDPNLTQLRAYSHQLHQNISTQLGSYINIDAAFNAFKNEEMSGDNFRNIQNECDEKFDLAKQTGIDYQHFMHLFYRYRESIDELIDKAYQQMNKERNPSILWKNTEQELLNQEAKVIQ
jgi:hypothetical protein